MPPSGHLEPEFKILRHNYMSCIKKLSKCFILIMDHLKSISSLFDFRDSENLERFWAAFDLTNFVFTLTAKKTSPLTAKLNLGLFFAVRIYFRSQVLFSQSGFIFAVTDWLRNTLPPLLLIVLTWLFNFFLVVSQYSLSSNHYQTIRYTISKNLASHSNMVQHLTKRHTLYH